MNAVADDAADTAAGAIDARGYRGTIACAAAGITYRQLDYWARTGLVRPSLPPGGAGSVSIDRTVAGRLYSFRDVIVLKVVKGLLDAGVSLHNIRTAIAHVQARECAELAGITLMSDGAAVYECVSPEQVVELMHAGQGVFGISVGAVLRETEAALSRLPAEPVDATGAGADTGGTILPPGAVDELAMRRRSRAV